jgi:signal transduction histidine kinase
MSSHRIDRSWQSFPLRDLVEEVILSLGSRLAAQAIEVFLDVPSDHWITGQRELLRRALENMVLGAIDAMPEGGALVATSAAEPHAIELEIADSGPALSDQQRHEAFELMPAAQRGGAGWGLAVVRRVAELHGGRVMVANCPDGGVAFTLRIPRPVALEAAA